MRWSWTFFLALTLSAAAMASQESPASTISTTPASNEQSPAKANSPSASTPATAPVHAAQQSETRKPPATKKTAPKAKHRAKQVQPEGAPRKIVIREGGADEPLTQIGTDLAPDDAVRQRQATEWSLQATGEALKRLAARPLDLDRQETVSQIQNYMNKARQALNDGDILRAGTLASKASLLADDLEKH